ncbi:glycyl-radical enzyme activating protein [Rhodovulum sp. BSW8]|uniref:Cobalamin-independent glycerol dehydratase small subunit n=1 Tax=Rhodovulum visakhapatnamense TaxID=364297 RepID=A0A4V3GUG7_9RHOB|nr:MULTISPECIES: glycyl-radical enzyme activating protein [Rhodovulum]OLS46265.1 glycyl-radical enzyme activating protein [Rhodovulum sulfidophilum]MBL3568007.1 glycyl-radical enzyme activating protein [Rhodovulum visakhapatnamense]MBL3578261.1 glycyl-radical enzyme activating protein [Rhodovulum visakhapatnamense]RBO51769.1 glycyl-radical enzyme activating protein [Rhodovulum sp. BSW8]TDX30681.1 cobalamin-independent glycerol dehydratase small subunit [Rhodovulum visakhapatnamense]
MSDIDFDKEGTVFDIQRYSIHDGPGLRTIVFLKGCPLRCRWCSNPESQSPEPELFFRASSCIKCGQCVPVCPTQALAPTNPGFVDRDKCVKCGTCAGVCPTQALTISGKKMTVAQVMQELRKDAIHYRRSGGGVTLSGGEPLFQHQFAKHLLMACHEQGWNTAMETTGYTTREIVRDVIPHVDHVLLDMKAIDPQVHVAQTGVENRIILENALCISSLTHTVVRIPVVPGVNDTVEAAEAVACFAKLMPGVDTVHLLPYHSFGENKYALLGRSYPMGNTPNMKPEEVAPLVEKIESHGLKCVIGG